MELLQEIQQVELMIDGVWSCNINQCYKIKRFHRTTLAHFTTEHPQQTARKNKNQKYQCPYCKTEFATVHTLIHHLQILNTRHRTCEKMKNETRYPAQIWEHVCQQNPKTRKHKNRIKKTKHE